jgi:hypothetical protein
MKDPDHYYKSFSKKDLSIRKISSPEDYHYFIEKSCRDFSVYEKNKIIGCISNVESVLKKVNDLLLNNLMDFYKNEYNLDKMLSIITGDSKISLRKCNV